jgi:hypothetical protein
MESTNMASEKDYRVLSPVKHNGKRYEEGSKITLTEALANPLVKSGAIGAWTEQAAPAKENGPEDPAERLAAVKDAISKLNIDSAELWTAGGVPKTEAIAKVTGWPVSAAERDAAWAEVKPKA